jgi:hypothetical protein
MSPFNAKPNPSRPSNIKTDSKSPDFGLLDPKAMTKLTALSGTCGALSSIVMDPPAENGTENGGSHSLIIQRARKELIREGDSSRELKEGSHSEKIAKIYTLEANDEIHLKSSGKIVIEAEWVSIVGKGGFVDISSGIVTIEGKEVHINCKKCSPAEGTAAKPALPCAAD